MRHLGTTAPSFLLFILVVLLSSCEQRDSVSDKASALGAQFVEKTGISGLAISVGIDDQIVWSEGFGYADLEQRVPISPALTRFRVGSIAKPMTAMAVAQLYEAKKLDLDAPIQMYVPTFPQKSGTITTRMLAGHLAGIRSYKGDEYYSTEAFESVSDALAVFKNDPLEHPPGSNYLYSSYGFNLISAVVEGASGQEFLTYMSAQVFDSLGMNQTIADHVVPIIRNRSRYYEIKDAKLVNAPWVDNSIKWAGGGFLSTSEDLIRFGFAHLSDKFLRPETIQMMWTSQSTSATEKTDYGIGWRIRSELKGRKVVFHGGSSVGGAADFHIYPESGLVIAAISNTSADNIPVDESLALVDSIAGLFLAE